MPRIQRSGEGIVPWSDEHVPEGTNDSFPTPHACSQFLLLLKPKPTETLLDVGCGNGMLLAEAVSLQLKPTGLEGSPEAAAISLKTAPQANVVLGSSQEIPFDSGSFDLVTCLDLGAYFAFPQAGLIEIQRVLRPGGRAALLLANSDFSGLNPTEEELVSDGMHYPLHIWKRMLVDAGLHMSHCQPEPWSEADGGRGLRRLARALTRSVWQWFPKKWISRFLVNCVKS